MADKKKKKKGGGGSAGKMLFLLILLVGSGGAGYVHIQKDTYDVEKSVTINKEDADEVWEYIGDFKQWSEWGPWAESDPTMTMTFAESTTEEGDTMKWSGKDGDGSITWIKLEEDKYASYEMQIADYPKATGSFRIVENDNDTTTVTWKASGSKGGFMGKGYFLYSKMEVEMGQMFDKGLANLKTKVEP